MDWFTCWYQTTRELETFSTSLVLCEGNAPVIDGFPSQRPVTRSSDVFFDLQLNKRLSKNIDAGDLRRHRAHYDVTVMRITKWCHSDAAKTLKKKMLWLIVSLLLYHHIYLNQCRLYSGFMPNFGLHYLAIHYFCMYACTTTKIWFHFRFPRSPETAILDGCKLR